MLTIDRVEELCRNPQERLFIDGSDREIVFLYCVPEFNDDPRPAEEIACRIWLWHKGALRGRQRLDPEVVLNDALAEVFQTGGGWLEDGKCDLKRLTLQAIWNVHQEARRLATVPEHKRPKDGNSVIPLEEFSDDSLTQLEAAEKRELLSALYTSIERLPARVRACVQRNVFGRQKISSIARDLNLPRYWVNRQLAKAYAELGRDLKHFGPVPAAFLLYLYNEACADAAETAVLSAAETAAEGLSASGSASTTTAASGSQIIGATIGWKAAALAVCGIGSIAAALACFAWLFKRSDPVPVANAAAAVEIVEKVEAAAAVQSAVDARADIRATTDSISSSNTPSESVASGSPATPPTGTVHVIHSDYLDVDFMFVHCGDGLWMSQTEVTQKQWKAIFKDTEKAINADFFVGDDLPADSKTPMDAEEFCKAFKGYFGILVRVPSLIEWNLAAGAGREIPTRYKKEPARYPRLEDVSEEAWVAGNSDMTTHSVGKKKPNPLGLFDMYGNVWEIVGDKNSGYRIAGGSALREPLWCKPDYTSKWDWDIPNEGIGFRLVFNAP